MTLTKWYAFPELADFPAGPPPMFHDFDRLFTEPASRPWMPAVDILENEEGLMLKADLPEVELKDIDIRLENGTLTLKGERKSAQDTTNGGYHRIERGHGPFARSFRLPDTVDPEKIKADYTNGVLTISLPTKETAKPRTVTVQPRAN